MKRRVTAVLLSLVVTVLLAANLSTSGLANPDASPEIVLATQPLLMMAFYPEDMSAMPASSAQIYLEIQSGLCCELLKSEIRVIISACTSPRPSGFMDGDDGVEYDSNGRTIAGESYLPGIHVDPDEAGCSLPINGSPVDVSITAEARTPAGGISQATVEWTFFSTGSGSTSPPPGTNDPPPFELTAINPRPLVPGQTRLISGKGLTSATEVYFNTGLVDSTFNSTTQRITFLVPEGIYCGEHTVQLRNPGAEREYSNIKTYTITQNCYDPNEDEDPPPPRRGLQPIIINDLSISSLSPTSGNPGTNVIINGLEFRDGDSVVLFGDETLTPDFLSGKQLRFTVPPNSLCGNTDVQVMNDLLIDDYSNVVTFNVTQPCTQLGSTNPPSEEPPSEDPPNDDPPPNDPPPNDDPPPTPPPPNNADEAEEFDTDNDCQISNNEFFAAVDLWISGSIDNAVFFAVLDAWITESSVCSASAGAAVSLRALPQGILILAAPESALGKLSIYDTSGRVVHTREVNGSRILWNLRDHSGSRVANGVYFVRVWSTGEMKAFVVLR